MQGPHGWSSCRVLTQGPHAGFSCRVLTQGPPSMSDLRLFLKRVAQLLQIFTVLLHRTILTTFVWLCLDVIVLVFPVNFSRLYGSFRSIEM